MPSISLTPTPHWAGGWAPSPSPLTLSPAAAPLLVAVPGFGAALRLYMIVIKSHHQSAHGDDERSPSSSSPLCSRISPRRQWIVSNVPWIHSRTANTSERAAPLSSSSSLLEYESRTLCYESRTYDSQFSTSCMLAPCRIRESLWVSYSKLLL